MFLLEVALFAAPCLVLIGLLVLGRFPGERAILVRRAASVKRRKRAARRWPVQIERRFASLLERTSRRLRGPPVPA